MPKKEGPLAFFRPPTPPPHRPQVKGFHSVPSPTPPIHPRSSSPQTPGVCSRSTNAQPLSAIPISTSASQWVGGARGRDVGRHFPSPLQPPTSAPPRAPPEWSIRLACEGLARWVPHSRRARAHPQNRHTHPLRMQTSDERQAGGRGGAGVAPAANVGAAAAGHAGQSAAARTPSVMAAQRRRGWASPSEGGRGASIRMRGR